jgi:transposase
MKRVARTIRAHLWGIVNAIVRRVTNAGAESIDAKIQWIENLACGFRSRERFRNATCSHCGGLGRSPATHTTS